MHVKDIYKFKKSFLRRLRAESDTHRSGWQRFLLIKLDARQALPMYPRLMPGALLLLDRHYNALTPYRKGESNMYAVLQTGHCEVRYVELAGKDLLLRPHNQSSPVEVIAIEPGKSASDYLAGRVAHVGLEA